MGGENPASEAAEEGINNAVNTLFDAQTSFLANPLFQGLQSQAQGQLNQPFTYQPADIARMQQQSAGTIHEAASGFLDRGMTRLAGTGSGTRGGAANNLLAETASRFAPALAAQNTQIEQRAMEQRNADLLNAANLATSALQQQYAWPRDIAQTNIGGAGIAGSLAGAPTPLQQGLTGIGGLTGAFLGGAGQAGGIPQLFGKP